MEGVADAQRRLGKVFGTQDFTVVLHDGPLAGQEVPHVHVHVMPRTKGDGGRCAGMAAFPDAPPIGSVCFEQRDSLSRHLQLNSKSKLSVESWSGSARREAVAQAPPGPPVTNDAATDDDGAARPSVF